jgi:hypothetical protein
MEDVLADAGAGTQHLDGDAISRFSDVVVAADPVDELEQGDPLVALDQKASTRP